MKADDVTTGYAPVNDLNLYYELHGEGPPLLLLHGVRRRAPLDLVEKSVVLRLPWVIVTIPVDEL